MYGYTRDTFEMKDGDEIELEDKADHIILRKSKLIPP